MKYKMKQLITMYEDKNYVYSLCICRNAYLIKDNKLNEEGGNNLTFSTVETFNYLRRRDNNVYEKEGKLYWGIKHKIMEGEIKQIKSLTKYLQYII